MMIKYCNTLVNLSGMISLNVDGTSIEIKFENEICKLDFETEDKAKEAFNTIVSCVERICYLEDEGEMKVVSSKTGYTKDGFPMGKILCRSEEEANHCIELAEEAIVEDYVTVDNDCEYLFKNSAESFVKKVQNDTHS